MQTNTSQYIPYDCISANIIEDDSYKDFPFFSGTGFFVYFPPYGEYIFYVSAKHCFTKNGENIFINKLKIPYTYKTQETTDKDSDEAIVFSGYLTMKHTEEDDDYEDLIIFVVDKDITRENKEILKKRALRLQPPDDIDNLLESLSQIKGNIRTVGFPRTSKKIDFDKKQAEVQPRGFYGKISKKGQDKYRYKFEQPSWKENEYAGFSGSPVLEILPVNDNNQTLSMQAVPIGILLSATQYRGEFISINLATNLIENYLNNNSLEEKKNNCKDINK